MHIKKYYKYEINNIVYVSDDAKILETMNILNAKEGYNLIRKNDGVNVGNSVWLVDEDNQDNYIEIKESENVDSK